jgi:hypothetical protein
LDENPNLRTNSVRRPLKNKMGFSQFPVEDQVLYSQTNVLLYFLLFVSDLLALLARS